MEGRYESSYSIFVLALISKYSRLQPSYLSSPTQLIYDALCGLY